MVDKLKKLWGSFSLLEEEDVEVEIQDRTVEGPVQRGKLCLVGKLLAERMVSKEIIKSTLLRGWKPSGTLSFKVLGISL